MIIALPIYLQMVLAYNAMLAGQPVLVQAEILRINEDARHLELQVALLVPLLASFVGLLNALLARRHAERPSEPSTNERDDVRRMRRLPDPKPSEAAEGMVFA